MSDELVRLVESEKRGADALASLSVVTFLSAALITSRFFGPFGYGFFAIAGGSALLWMVKRRALGRLLHRRNEIDRVERVRWLGRPVVRVDFRGGGAITLPTWNADRERVVALLETHDLPPARLLR
jgi:hypothetical protein